MTQTDIVLVAINARYTHTSYGAMCVLAGLGELRSRARLFEFTLKNAAREITDAVSAVGARIVGVSVYIWNRQQVEALVPLLRDSIPGVTIVLGGPEIGYDLESALARDADCVVRGDGENAFRNVCQAFLSGASVDHVVDAEPLDACDMIPPLDDYRNSDIAQRVLYVETSRGCPCRCAYCLSAREHRVRLFDLDRVLPAIERLLVQGARRLKFIDRSFNLYPEHASRILEFLLSHWREGMQVHFEMTPSMPQGVFRELLLKFPPGGLHIEVGVQTLTPRVARAVGRGCDLTAIGETIRFLIKEARAEVHADLIAGLPGETLAEFRAGFDTLVAMRPDELQVGILKRLHGAPITGHAEEWGMVFDEIPPYEIQQTSSMSRDELDAIRRFAVHWDRAANRAHFPSALPMLLASGQSSYASFDAYSRRLAEEAGLYGVSLIDQMRVLFDVACDRGVSRDSLKAALRRDYLDGGRRICLPRFLALG